MGLEQLQGNRLTCKVSKFLTVDWVRGQFANQKDVARKGYRKFVAAGAEVMDESPWKKNGRSSHIRLCGLYIGYAKPNM